MYKISRNNNGKFELIEIESQLVINEYDDYNEAKSWYSKLKKGVAFEGWTPSFFLIQFHAA